MTIAAAGETRSASGSDYAGAEASCRGFGRGANRSEEDRVMALSTPLQDMEEAEHAYERVRPEMETLSVADLSPMSVDVVSATSIALGVSDRILSFRDRMAALPEFDMRNVDN